MKLLVTSTLVLAFAAQSAVADSWFGKPGASMYDKWHETELERWLSDYGIPYPTPSDRKNLLNSVKDNWESNVVTPYNKWDAQTLQNYLSSRGQQVKADTEKDTSSLIAQVKGYWTETEDSASQAYGSVQNWIFDTWTDSQLKAFADKNGIPVPQPRARDSLLKTVRENYQSAANKISETTNYPGDWLYESWSESDLKAWFDSNGYSVPQPTTRDKLIAEIRRNSRSASLAAQAAYASASSSAASAQQSLSDALLDSWSDNQIKEWADKNGIKVPQGSKRNELLALARKYRAQLTGDNVSASASSAYGAATSSAGNQYTQATQGFAGYTNWVKAQIGLATGPQASASLLSASASKSASSASSSASKSADGAASDASKSAQSVYDAAAASAASATDRVKQEL